MDLTMTLYECGAIIYRLNGKEISEQAYDTLANELIASELIRER
jgi:hypothetical protein